MLVVAATSLAACAPLVAMEPPSPQGPRISDLELVPDRVTAGCPVEMRFRFRATGEDVARVVAGWAVRRRTIAKPGHAAFAFELFNRAVACLLLYAFDNRFLDLGAEVSDFPEVFPPGGEWARELLHEMLNASLTATEKEQQIGSHYTPTQPRPPAHGSV